MPVATTSLRGGMHRTLATLPIFLSFRSLSSAGMFVWTSGGWGAMCFPLLFLGGAAVVVVCCPVASSAAAAAGARNSESPPLPGGADGGGSSNPRRPAFVQQGQVLQAGGLADYVLHLGGGGAEAAAVHTPTGATRTCGAHATQPSPHAPKQQRSIAHATKLPERTTQLQWLPNLRPLFCVPLDFEWAFASCLLACTRVSGSVSSSTWQLAQAGRSGPPPRPWQRIRSPP